MEKIAKNKGINWKIKSVEACAMAIWIVFIELFSILLWLKYPIKTDAFKVLLKIIGNWGKMG